MIKAGNISRNIEDEEILSELDLLRRRIHKIESQTIDLLNAGNDSIVPDKTSRKSLIRPLLLVSIITAVLMTIYEALKQWISPDLTLWQSHSITIFFATIIAPAGAYLAFQKINEMRQKALAELKERKKAEAELLKAHEKLEARVKERTAQLSLVNNDLQQEIRMRRDAEESLRKYAEELLLSRDLLRNKAEELTGVNKQLKENEKELTQLNKSKDKFFSILAHDLRSPFTSLLGLTEFLENEFQSLDHDEVQKIVMNISVSSRKVYKLLENLLQWSRVQTGKIDFSPESFCVNTLIDDVIALYKINSDKKEIKVNNLLYSTVTINADKSMLDTVFRNLLSNAIKFTPTGGTINVIAKIPDSDFVQFTVADSGVGLSRAQQNTIFELENNPSAPGTENERGTGLGLILCKEFVNKHGGKIWVDSIPGKGSSFHFVIPRNIILSENGSKKQQHP